MLKLFRYLKPYKGSIAVTMLLLFLQTLSDLYLPNLLADIVDKGIVFGDTDYIWRVGGLMLLVAAGGAIASVLASYLSAKVAVAFGSNLRTRVFTRVENFSLHEFDHLGTSTLITRTTNDITQVQNVTVMMLRMLVMAPMMAIGGIIMAVSKDPTLSLVLVVVLPILAAAIGLIAYLGIPLFKSMQFKLDRLNLVVREGLTGMRVIRAFNRSSHESERFTAANQDLTQTAVKVNMIMGTMLPTMMLLLNLTTVAIIWYGGIRINAGQMQVGDLMAFIQYVMQIMFSLIMVSFLMTMIPRASASATRVFDVLQTEPKIKDAEQVKAPTDRRGHVEFRHVSFSYPGAEQPAISEISFSGRPGEVTAIIGGTGSGKSTLVSLIPRFYDVESGSILIDGVDVREMSQEALRAKIGFTPQTALLFSGSIAANIRFGKEDATDEEVQRAAEIAQATEFINDMKDGFESIIAQGGRNVSGGQKQRLAIARSLVRRPAIYVFDDNFSALDFKTDAKLRAALRSETASATVLLVAQRVTTVMDATRIIVLDDGRMVGMGTHRELLENCKVYREIAASQLSEEELA